MQTNWTEYAKELKADEVKSEKRFADLNGLPVRISPWRIDWDSREYTDWLTGSARGDGVKR